MKSSDIPLIAAAVCLTQLAWSPSAAGPDLSGVPSLEDSTAEIAYTGPGIPLVMVVPDGSGYPLTAALDEDGNVVDATITLHLRDYAADPIAYFPLEDIWLDTGSGGMNPCIGGANPDSNTDLNGSLFVVLGDLTILSEDYYSGAYHFRCDFNNDGVLNLNDVQIFAGHYGARCR